MTNGAALLHLGTRLYRLQVEALESLTTPLSVRQYRILERVDAGITSQGTLAELARRKPPTISRSVDSLVRQGMLTRSQSAEDRRAVSLALTSTGRQVLKRARKVLRQLEGDLELLFASDIPDLADRCAALYGKTEGLVRSDSQLSGVHAQATSLLD